MKLESISRNDNGDFYVVYSYPSIQKITKSVRKQKNKRELMIIGIPKRKFKQWIETGNLLNDCDEE